MNLVVLTGNVTKDPEMRFTPTGTPVMTFSLATNRSVKKGDNWESVASFHNCTYWGKVVEKLSTIIKKGMRLTVKGRLDYQEWEKDGVKRYRTHIVIDDVVLPPKTNSTPSGMEEVAAAQPDNDEVDLEEIPF